MCRFSGIKITKGWVRVDGLDSLHQLYRTYPPQASRLYILSYQPQHNVKSQRQKNKKIEYITNRSSTLVVNRQRVNVQQLRENVIWPCLPSAWAILRHLADNNDLAILSVYFSTSQSLLRCHRIPFMDEQKMLVRNPITFKSVSTGMLLKTTQL